MYAYRTCCVAIILCCRIAYWISRNFDMYTGNSCDSVKHYNDFNPKMNTNNRVILIKVQETNVHVSHLYTTTIEQCITLLYPESNSDIITASSFSNVLKRKLSEIEGYWASDIWWFEKRARSFTNPKQKHWMSMDTNDGKQGLRRHIFGQVCRFSHTHLWRSSPCSSMHCVERLNIFVFLKYIIFFFLSILSVFVTI